MQVNIAMTTIEAEEDAMAAESIVVGAKREHEKGEFSKLKILSSEHFINAELSSGAYFIGANFLLFSTHFRCHCFQSTLIC